MFVDRVTITVIAGKGGDGTTSFRREKYIPNGGPDGGDGGKGGDVIFEATTHLSTLLDLKYQRRYRAADGGKGMPKKMHGKNAEDLIIKVPIGTSIIDQQTNRVLCDLTHHGQQALIAKAGRGGRGNYRFTSSRNTAPDISERGEPGQFLELQVELKLLADVGLVGFPSVGKSTLLSVVSRAKPEIADYHFTTIVPNLGVVQVPDGRSFVMADLPGLIAGASQGKGLGYQFLRHIERCRVIVHILDMGSVDGRDPLEDYEIINHELAEYQYRLMERPQIVVANKCDLEEAKENVKRFKEAYPDIELIEISAFMHQGLEPLLYRIADLLAVTPEFLLVDPEEDLVEHIFEDLEAFEVKNLGNGQWEVVGQSVEKLILMTNFSSDDAIYRLARIMRERGVDDALRHAGAEPGDSVAIADFVFEFSD